MISVTLVDADVFEVTVDGTSPTRHRVRLSADWYRKLSGGAFSHEWVVVQAFRFLLEREANTSIPTRFDMAEISARFPEFEADIAQRLAH